MKIKSRKVSVKSRLVCGVGANDADYLVHRYKTVNGKLAREWVCPFYVTWKSMLERCYSEKHQAKYHTYIGCSVAPEWHLFSVFRAWMVNRDWEGGELDKDILCHGNKIYGPDTCVIVSRSLNAFLNDHSAGIVDRAVGTHQLRSSGKFQAHCRNPFADKNEYLGLFSEQDSAHEAWRARKHQHACRYADMQSDPRIAQALRARYVEIKEVK